jgi:hypothetical protein
MRNADQINQFTWAGYYFRNPFSIFRRLSINTNQWLNWDFGGNFLYGMANTNSHATFRNNYSIGGGVTRIGEVVSNTALRGGPSSAWPGGWEYSIYMNTDHRKRLSASVGGYTNQGDEGYEDYREGWFQITGRPTDALRVSLNPSFSRNRPEMQYIATESFADRDRYLFGRLDQKTVNITFRIDYCVTPNFTVQYYGSPFLSSGRYTEFKRITDSRAEAFRDRFDVFDGGQIAYDAGDAVYGIDEDLDGRGRGLRNRRGPRRYQRLLHRQPGFQRPGLQLQSGFPLGVHAGLTSLRGVVAGAERFRARWPVRFPAGYGRVVRRPPARRVPDQDGQVVLVVVPL